MMAAPIADLAACPDRLDAVVVGAGPAGLAAATTLAAGGARVLLADENATPGGQIYRGATQAEAADRRRFGGDGDVGRGLARAFLDSGAAYAPGATVWSVALPAPGGDLEVGISLNGAARLLAARQVIVAAGAQERPMPIPGWTLPGVMGAGAAQTALKASGLVPAGRVVLAGTGPLLLLVAMQLRAAGVAVAALLDTTPAANWRRAAPHAPGFLRSPFLAKGLRLLAAARALPVIRGVTRIEARGDGRLSEVAFAAGRRTGILPAEHLLLHQGVVPQTGLLDAAGCAHAYDEAQLAFRTLADSWGETSVPGLAVAGDGGGIAGAEAAALTGGIAALGALARLGLATPEEAARRDAPLRRRLAPILRGRAFLDALFRPAEAFRVPADDDTIVCRCEEVTAGAIRAAAAGGAMGPNQLKTFLRCGMGPCQGRMCGLTVTGLIAATRGVDPARVGALRLRAPIKPLRLAELAGLPRSREAHLAVVGDDADWNAAQGDTGEAPR